MNIFIGHGKPLKSQKITKIRVFLVFPVQNALSGSGLFAVLSKPSESPTREGSFDDYFQSKTVKNSQNGLFSGFDQNSQTGKTIGDFKALF